MATVPTQNLPQFPEPTLPEQLESSEEYRNVLAMTQRLFPGPVEMCRKHDPELPKEYVVFDVHPRGTFEQIMAREYEWHHQLGELAPIGFFLYRLAVWFDDVSE